VPEKPANAVHQVRSYYHLNARPLERWAAFQEPLLNRSTASRFLVELRRPNRALGFVAPHQSSNEVEKGQLFRPYCATA
jgi:hypothetical protein